MADEQNVTTGGSQEPPKRSGAAERIDRGTEAAKRVGAIAGERARKASSAAKRWVQRAGSAVGTQTAVGAELTRAKRDQLRSQRRIDRLEKSVGQAVVREYEPGKESIAVAPGLAADLESLRDARSELEAIERRIIQARNKFRRPPELPASTGPASPTGTG